MGMMANVRAFNQSFAFPELQGQGVLVGLHSEASILSLSDDSLSCAAIVRIDFMYIS